MKYVFLNSIGCAVDALLFAHPINADGTVDTSEYMGTQLSDISDEALEAMDDADRLVYDNLINADWCDEVRVSTVNGESLAYPSKDANPDGVGYVRFLDKYGREIVHWNSDEWAEDPEIVMGAIMGALTNGAKHPHEGFSGTYNTHFNKHR